jgi:hypothetical protein
MQSHRSASTKSDLWPTYRPAANREELGRVAAAAPLCLTDQYRKFCAETPDLTQIGSRLSVRGDHPSLFVEQHASVSDGIQSCDKPCCGCVELTPEIVMEAFVAANGAIHMREHSSTLA